MSDLVGASGNARRPTCRILLVGGTDSGGGAGLVADAATVLAMGAHPCVVATAVTAQDSVRVHGAWELPAEAVQAQLAAVLGDIGADAAKTGMLSGAGAVEAVGAAVRAYRARSGPLPLVVDPVLLSSSGQPLLDEAGLAALRRELLPLATVVTPNLAEAAALTGSAVTTVEHAAMAARLLSDQTGGWVVVTGGHLAGDPTEVLAGPDGEVWQSTHSRIDTPHSHGTGCTLASALAVGLGRGLPVAAALESAVAAVRRGLQGAYPLGSGTGTLRRQVMLEADGAS